jgi:hypothetical protein
MNAKDRQALRTLEGQHVSVGLIDGTRLDDVVLVSAGRTRHDTIWLFVNGQDRFIPAGDIWEVWQDSGQATRFTAQERADTATCCC